MNKITSFRFLLIRSGYSIEQYMYRKRRTVCAILIVQAVHNSPLEADMSCYEAYDKAIKKMMEIYAKEYCENEN